MQKHFTENDPITRYVQYLKDKKLIDDAEVSVMNDEAAKEIAAAERSRKRVPSPSQRMR